MSESEFNHDALVDKTNTLLDEVDRVGDQWHSGKDSTESVRQLRVLASGYIQSLEQAVASMGECMNQVLDENARLLHAKGEIASAAKVMEELARGLVEKKRGKEMTKLIRSIIVYAILIVGVSGTVRAGELPEWAKIETPDSKVVEVSGVKVSLHYLPLMPDELRNMCNGRRYKAMIFLDGVINSDTSFIVENMLNEIASGLQCSPRKETPLPSVFMNSGGGNLADGYQLGAMFRYHRVVTKVSLDNICASSCAIAFLGGAHRFVFESPSRSGRLLFHAPYKYVGNSIQINCKNSKVNADLKKYYRQAIGKKNGDRLYDRTMRYCSTETGWTVNGGAAFMYGITTEVTRLDRDPPR